MSIFRTVTAEEKGSTVIEFLLVIPVLFLLIWGAVLIGTQLLDGMLLGYGVYEEARRGAVADGDGSKVIPVVRTIVAWSKQGLMPLLQVSGERTVEGKDVVVKASFRQPWLGLFPRSLEIPRSLSQFAQQLLSLEQSVGAVQFSYFLPRENSAMYPKSLQPIGRGLLTLLTYVCEKIKLLYGGL